MAYNKICSYSFLEAHTDVLGGTPRRYQVSFLRQDWQIAPFEIRGDAEPLELEWMNSNDDVFQPVQALRATFNITAEASWNPLVLNATGKYDIQAIVECDQTGTGDYYRVFFMGWVQPYDSSDLYGARPYPKTLHATDGLGLLKDKPIVDAVGRRLTGSYITLASILQHGLAQTGFYRPMTVGMNLYHLADMAAGQTVNGHADPARCPFSTTRAKPEFLLTDKYDPVTSIDAIQDVLRPFGCRLGQWDGDWQIQRIVELDGRHNTEDPLMQSILTRRYNSPDNLYAGPFAGGVASYDVRVRVGDKDSGEKVRVLSGSPQEALSGPKESVKIEQNFGRIQSEFPGGDFAVLDDTGLPSGWDRNIFVPREAQVIGLGTETNPRQLKILGAGDNLNALAKQSIGVRIQFPRTSMNPVTGLPDTLPQFKWAKRFTVKGRYQLFKARSMQMSVFCRRADGLYLGQKGGGWVKFPERKDNVTINFDNSLDKGKVYNPVATDFSVTFDDMDSVTDLWIRFHDPEDLDRLDGKRGGQKNPDAYVLIWNLSLSTDRDNGLKLNGQSAIRTLANRTNYETVASLKIGDVPDAATPYNHTGTLFDLAGNATSNWREGRSSALNPQDLGKTLINALVDDRARQEMNVQPAWEGDIIGYLPWGPFSVLEFNDIGVIDRNGLFISTQFIITRYRYRARTMVNSISCEKLATDGGSLPQSIPGKKLSYWDTPDGDVLLSVDESTGQISTPVEPISSPLPPSFGAIRDIISRLAPGTVGNGNTIGQHLPGLIYTGPRSNGNILILEVPGHPPVYSSGVTYYRPMPPDDQLPPPEMLA